MQDVWHQDLEASVCHTCHLLCAIEVLRSLVTTFLALAHVVHQILRHLAQRTAFLAEIHADTRPAFLRSLDALLDCMRQVRPARADIGAKDVAAIALIVHSASKLHRLIWNFLWVAPDVDRQATDGRQEELQISPSYQLRVHGIGLLEDGLAQCILRDPETLSDTWEVPHRLDGGLRDKALPICHQHFAVCHQPPLSESFPALRQLDVCFGHCDGGTDVVPPVEPRGESFRDGVSVRVEGHDTLGVMPSRERSDLCNRSGHAQLWKVVFVHIFGDHCKGAINRVAA
mmetsp:Transcript_362/g.984  ORF Transcript_362/g.984 Transcript_362/m.984 type:complete len:286 (+) Transcript_362:625-1482(+)